MIAVTALALTSASFAFSWRTYVLQPRRDVLRRLVGYKGYISESEVEHVGLAYNEFLVALNEAKVVFGNVPEVVQALENLRIGSSGPDDLIVNLVVTMAKASGYTTKRWPKNYMAGSFAPRPHVRSPLRG